MWCYRNWRSHWKLSSISKSKSFKQLFPQLENWDNVYSDWLVFKWSDRLVRVGALCNGQWQYKIFLKHSTCWSIRVTSIPPRISNLLQNKDISECQRMESVLCLLKLDLSLELLIEKKKRQKNEACHKTNDTKNTSFWIFNVLGNFTFIFPQI